ncbi:LppU/SCO3897 family protein [Mycobacteroides chelonae]|uniref:LppU/SCO3897 family protein n=1 Tax=Mycobacteroides chelonae TaxID=1774 RepID=UPI001041C060|nr:hypothetical protein [Mycobacteroides chelonae]
MKWAVPVVLTLTYWITVRLLSSYGLSWPRWLFVLAAIAGVLLLHRWPRPATVRWTSVASVSLLALSLCLDVWSTWYLASKGQYAGTYIGIGMVRLLSFVMAFAGLIVFPTHIVDDPNAPKDLSRLTRRGFAVFGVVVLVCVSWITIRSCATNTQPAAPRNKVLADFDKIPGEFVGTGEGVGGCVNLSGKSPDNPFAQILPCGSREANYRIVQVATTPDQCVSDADQRYYSRTGKVEFTYCLDYNWSRMDCVKMANGQTWFATKVSCDDIQSYPIEKPFSVILDTTSLKQCANGGWAHAQRKFTICSTTLKKTGTN